MPCMQCSDSVKHLCSARVAAEFAHHAMLKKAGVEALKDGLVTAIASAMASHAGEGASHLALHHTGRESLPAADSSQKGSCITQYWP